MNFRVLPEHCFLLSEVRVQAFQESGIQPTKERIQEYIRNILPKGQLSNLANETGIDIGIIVYLSNFTDTYKQLKTVLMKSSSKVLRNIPFDVFTKVIKLFPDFKINDVSKIEAKWVELEERERSQEESNKKEKYIAGMRYLLGFFFLENSPENQRVIRESEVGNIFVLDEVREYCEEEGIGEVGDIKLQNFLVWYAEKHGFATDPDSLLSLKILISGIV